MSDGSVTVTMSPVNRIDPLAMLLEGSAGTKEFVSASVIQQRRGKRSQTETARVAGISQAFLSELEQGRKRLTPATARKLAPALGTTQDQLLQAVRLEKLARVAWKERIDLRSLLDVAQWLAEVLPSGRDGDELIDALVGIAREGPKPLM